MNAKKLIAAFLGISLLGISFVIAADYTERTATNTATITDADTGHSASASVSVTHKQPNNTMIVQKWVDNPLPELGEMITYTIRAKNDADTLVAKGVNLIDDFDENKVAIIASSLHVVDGDDNPVEGCTVDASRLFCDFGDIDAGEEILVSYSVYTIAVGVIVNMATTKSAYGESTGDCTVLVRDRETPWLMTKHPDKGTIERGETVSYTVSIMNQAPDKTYYDLRLVDNYPENTIELESIISDADVSCQDDGAEIRCQIPSLAPGETKSFTATFRAIMDGVAQNTVSINDREGNIDGVSSTIVVTEPIAQSITLSSNCDGRKILVGQKCPLRLLANYSYLDPEDISNNENVTYYGFEEIGTLEGNILTVTTADYAQIHARYFTGHQEIESNTITFNVDNALGIGTDNTGKHIVHIPLRIHQGASETGVFDQVLESGEVIMSPGARAKYDRLVINGYGGSGNYTWFLEDPTVARISHFSTGVVCPPANDGLECANSSNIVLESLSSTETTTTLQIRDDMGNVEEIMVHLLPAATKRIEIMDENGVVIREIREFPLDENISFFANIMLWGEIKSSNTGENLNWEVSSDGGEWSTEKILGGVFHPETTGVFSFRAKRTQKVALPGSENLTEQEEVVISEPITIHINGPIPIIDSIRTAGNLGIAKGARETLFIRIRHFGTFSDIHDIEINLVRGKYESLADIPSDAQYFSIENLPEEVIQSVADDKTTLLQIPFFIPLLAELQDGMHTIVFSLHNKNGQPGENIATALMSIFIGTPQKGDGNLDGEIDLRDAVIAQRTIKKTISSDSLILLALDIDENGKIETYDFVTIFQTFLKKFLDS